MMSSTFAGDSVYASESDSDSYTVINEDAVVSDIAPSIIQVDGSDSDVDNLVLTVTIDESPDGFLSGALPNAPSGQTGLRNAVPVTVSLVRISNNANAGSCSTALPYTTVDSDTVTDTCSIANVGVDTYETDAVIGGDYFTGSGVGALVVFDPALGFITGGGRYSTSEGSLTASHSR